MAMLHLTNNYFFLIGGLFAFRPCASTKAEFRFVADEQTVLSLAVAALQVFSCFRIEPVQK